MKDMKGKKGMTLVIAVGKPSPKSPMDTAKPDKDEKKKELAQRGFGRLEPTTLAQIAREQGLPYTQTSDIRPGTNYDGRRKEMEALLARRRALQAGQPNTTQSPEMIQRSDDAFDMAWSLIKNYNMMGVPASQSMMTDLQAARQRVNELDAAAEMEQDPQRKLQLKMQAQQLYDQLTMMMSARR
tara:strand:+ start:633 stop:1184 length:552 start_codon:yes stop_codon:yes gene_type:complete